MRSRTRRQQRAIEAAPQAVLAADRAVEADKYRCPCANDVFMVGIDKVTKKTVIRCNRCGMIYDIMAQTLTTTRKVA